MNIPINTRRHIPWIAGLLLGLLIWLLLGKSAGPLPRLNHAQQLYLNSCAYCHGNDGRGNINAARSMGLDPVVLDLGKPSTQNKTDRLLEIVIENGSGPMPPFRDTMSGEDIHELVLYLRNLTPSHAISTRK